MRNKRTPSFGIKRTKPQIPKLVHPATYYERSQARHPSSFVVPSNLSEPKGTQLSITSLKNPNTRSRTLISKNPLPKIADHVKSNNSSIDEFIMYSQNMPLNEAIERFLSEQLNATCLYWQDEPNLQILYNVSKHKQLSKDEGLAGWAYVNRSTLNTCTPHSHQSFQPSIEADYVQRNSSVLCFPLFGQQNNLMGIVQLVRNDVFNPESDQFIDAFSRKFTLLSKFLVNTPSLDTLAPELLQMMSVEQFFAIFKSKLPALFNCRTCEIWKYNKDSQKVHRNDESTEMTLSSCGIVSEALKNSKLVNCAVNRLHHLYNSVIDGEEQESVLAMPVVESSGNNIYAVVMRSKKLFLQSEEDTIRKLSPYIILAMENCEIYNDYQKTKIEQEGLAVLLEIAEILSSQLDITKLTEIIMKKGRQLTNADRCSLFLVSQDGERLVSTFSHGLSNLIDIPINAGIVGKTISEAKPMIIADAYENPYFDPTTDETTGYKTKTLLTVPIYNYRGEIVGVTEMVNKLDNRPFTQWDLKLIQIFNVFCGISIENAQLYKESLDLTNQLHSFLDVSFSLSKTENIRLVLKDILQNAREVIGAERMSLFIIDRPSECMTAFLADGDAVPERIPLKNGIAAHCANSGEAIIVNDVYHDPRFNRSIDSATGYRTKNVVAAPVTSSSGEVMGVAEMVNKNGDFTSADLKLLQSFATFAALSLENSRLKTITIPNSVEIEIMNYIGESEKADTTKIPNKLMLEQSQIDTIRSVNFFALDYESLDLTKILFEVFYRFGLPEHFRISNEMLFRFIYTIRKYYHSVPYHNWVHAIDVTQYLAYQIELSKAKLTKEEILGLIVAAICHDAGHDGYNNVFNVKAETPLGILYKDQSVMETHHCSVAIEVLTKDECNLFYTLRQSDLKKMWSFVIQLILATDMAHHFSTVKTAAEALDNNLFNIEDPEFRMLALKILIKVADISNVSRPFKIADKWCDVLSVEFFRQGDQEKLNGIGFTSPMNDRENSNKPKSQIGFYNFICIPLYSCAARIFPGLEVNLENVKSNLEVWKNKLDSQ